MRTHSPPFNDSCDILVTERDAFGNYKVTETIKQECLLRDIRTVRRTSNGELRDSDGQIWFPTNTDIAEGDHIRGFNDKTYQIERITRAKGLRKTVQFLKADIIISDVVFPEVS